MKNIFFCFFFLFSSVALAKETPSRDTIRDVQRLLTIKGLYSGPIDGTFGNRTREGIRLYRIQNDLSLKEEVNTDLNP